MRRLFPSYTHPTRIILIVAMLLAGGYFLITGETALGLVTLAAGLFFGFVLATNHSRGGDA